MRLEEIKATHKQHGEVVTYGFSNGTELTVELDFNSRKYVVRHEDTQRILKTFDTEALASAWCALGYQYEIEAGREDT